MGATTSTPSLPPPGAGALAGRWEVHSLLLVIDAGGYGILDWRTYNTCGTEPPPCDIFNGNENFDGGHATLSLTARNATSVAQQKGAGINCGA